MKSAAVFRRKKDNTPLEITHRWPISNRYHYGGCESERWQPRRVRIGVRMRRVDSNIHEHNELQIQNDDSSVIEEPSDLSLLNLRFPSAVCVERWLNINVGPFSVFDQHCSL